MSLNRCLFCSNLLDKNDSTLVDATVLEIIEVLFENSNVESEIGSGMCYACEEKLKVAFKFKGLCINTEDILHPYISSNVENNEKIDFKAIYAKEKQCEEPNDGYICRLCLKLVDECDKHLFLKVLDEKNVKDTFKIYLPEVNLDSSEDPIICEPCLQSLINFLDFIASSRPINTIVKVEPVENLQELYINLEPLDIVSVKKEKDSGKPERETILKKFEKISGSGLYRCQLCSKEYKTIQHMVKHMYSHLEIRGDGKVCSYKSRYQNDLNKHEINSKYKSSIKSHKQIDNGEILKCTLCSFQNRSKRSMRYHLLRHSKRIIYKCDICSFEMSTLAYLRVHKKLKHPHFSQVKMYKCSVCTYETDTKDSFKTHMIVHKNNSEVKFYICYDCGAKAKYKYRLKEHIQKYHMKQDESDIKIYKCPKCSHENKNITLLKQHITRIHNNFRIHSCKQCDMKTKYLNRLTDHVRIMHNDGADVEFHHCQICSFYTAYPENLARHMIVHKNGDKVKLHFCKICDFSNRCLNQVKRHAKLLHSSNIKILKCELCTFSTKYRWYMSRHMKRHKDISKVDPYQCAKCSFKTIDRSALINHLLVHKSPSEVKMYKCPDCSFQTKYKSYLTGHKVVHSDTNGFECDQCEYKTKRKSSLKLHQSRLHGGATTTN